MNSVFLDGDRREWSNCPGSHKHGVVKAGHDLETTSYPLWTLDRDTVTELANRAAALPNRSRRKHATVFTPTSSPSPPNISPFGRTIVYLSLCEVSNHIRAFNREEWIAPRLHAHRGLEDNCLQELLSERVRELNVYLSELVRRVDQPVRVGLIGAGVWLHVLEPGTDDRRT